MAGQTMHEPLRQIQRLFTHGTVTGLSDPALLHRFAQSRDEEAFALIVQRHGPMVLSVCRGVLRNPSDAEDAFQATFLSLARQARSIRVEDSLGGWLHRVARRISVKANTRAIRRKSREHQNIEPDRLAAKADDETLRALHEEVDRLPEADRRALVLCALEGLTQAEAAEVLGIGEATVRRRLTRAKDRLKARLDLRGFAIPPLLGSSTVPLAWASAASKLAVADAAGLAIPSGVAALAWRLGAIALIRKFAVPLAVFGLAAGLVGYMATRSEPEPKPPVEPPRVVAQVPVPVPAVVPKPEEQTIFQGRVLDPEGRPFFGASVFARPSYRSGITRLARSAADGRFKVDFDAKDQINLLRDLANERVDGQRWNNDSDWSYIEEWPGLIAVAPGFGVGVAAVGPNDEPIIRLVLDEPVEGRVIDLQGRPVVGASVHVRALMCPRQGDLTPWLKAARDAADRSEFGRANYQLLSMLARQPKSLSTVFPDLLPAVKTDADGRFRLSGIGRDRVAWVVIDGAGIEARLVAVATRADVASFVVSSIVDRHRDRISNPSEDLTVVGSKFDHLASPGRTVEGKVVDARTKAPIVGAKVVPNLESFIEWESENRYQGVTDAQGRYRIEGLPEGTERRFEVQIPADQPYRGVSRTINAGTGLTLPTIANFAIERGVWVEGRVLDGPFGSPLVDVQVYYHVFEGNSHLPQKPDWPADDEHSVRTDREGRYRVVAYPGRGLLSVWVGNGFATGIGTDKVSGLTEDQFGRKLFPTLPEPVYPENLNLVADVNPPEGAESVTLDLALQKGMVREGRAIGPDGVVLGELLGSGLWSGMSGPQKVKNGRIVVKNLSPGQDRWVIVRADGPKLIGVTHLKADEEGPFEVKLVPWATLKGRLVDAEGKPRTKGLTLSLRDDMRLPGYVKGCTGYSSSSAEFLLDADGRFLVEAILPGEPFDAEIVEGQLVPIQTAAEALVLKPGEPRDLGDVVVKKP